MGGALPRVVFCGRAWSGAPWPRWWGFGGGSGLGSCCTFSFDSGLVVLVALAAFLVASCSSSLLLVAEMKLVWRPWWTVFARSGLSGGVGKLLDMFEIVACLS